MSSNRRSFTCPGCGAESSYEYEPCRHCDHCPNCPDEYERGRREAIAEVVTWLRNAANVSSSVVEAHVLNGLADVFERGAHQATHQATPQHDHDGSDHA